MVTKKPEEQSPEETTQQPAPEPQPEPEIKPADQPIEVEKGGATPEQIKEAETKYYTIKQLADELGYSKAWITQLCQTQRIKAVKPLSGRWRIPPSEVERIRKEGIPPLPREQPAEDATNIVVEGKHLDRVQTKPAERAEEKEGDEKVPWPLNLVFKPRRKEE